MELNRTSIYVVGGLVVLAGSFAAGRYTVPTKVETRTEYVDRLQVVKTVVVDRVTETKYRRVIETKPDGSSRTEETNDTRTVERENENTKVDTVAEVVSVTKTETYRPDWQISALAGTHIGNALNLGQAPSFTFGVHVQRRILGPLTLGVFGLSSGTVGLSAGIQL